MLIFESFQAGPKLVSVWLIHNRIALGLLELWSGKNGIVEFRDEYLQVSRSVALLLVRQVTEINL